MKNYKYIYESYIDDRLDNEEALELLLELSDNRSSDFWQFLKLRKHWKNFNQTLFIFKVIFLLIKQFLTLLKKLVIRWWERIILCRKILPFW